MDPVKVVNSSWGFCKGSAVGRFFFSLLVGMIAPYSGTTFARVLKIESGESKLVLNDRRGVRNHLGSIHAIALTNVAELASGLALFSKVPEGTRGMIKEIEMEYFKKARGRILVEGLANPPAEITENIVLISTSKLFDNSGDLVASFNATWQIGPRKVS